MVAGVSKLPSLSAWGLRRYLVGQAANCSGY